MPLMYAPRPALTSRLQSTSDSIPTQSLSEILTTTVRRIWLRLSGQAAFQFYSAPAMPLSGARLLSAPVAILSRSSSATSTATAIATLPSQSTRTRSQFCSAEATAPSLTRQCSTAELPDQPPLRQAISTATARLTWRLRMQTLITSRYSSVPALEVSAGQRSSPRGSHPTPYLWVNLTAIVSPISLSRVVLGPRSS